MRVLTAAVPSIVAARRYSRFGRQRTMRAAAEGPEPYQTGLVLDDDAYDTSTHRTPPQADRSAPLVTYLLLAVNVIIFLIMYRVSNGHVEQVGGLFGDKDDELIREGQTWRIITAIFLHGGVAHIAVNSLSLYIFGTQMERIYGARKYFIIYMVAGICGYILSYLHSPASSVGASGAIFGLVGAGLVFPIRYKRLVPARARSQILSQLFFITILNLGLGATDPNIDNSAHIGGLIGGGLAALFLIPTVLERGPRPHAAEAMLTAAATAMLVLAIWAGFRQWHWVKYESTHTVTAPGSDPWWSITVPTTWKQEAPSGYRWRESSGGEVILTVNDPLWMRNALLILRAAGPNAERVSIDGKAATRALYVQGSTIMDLYVVQPYQNATVVFVMRCPVSALARADAEMQAAVRSFRFVHPPDDVLK